MARRLGALALPVGIVALALLLLPAASAGPGAIFRASVATGGEQGNGRSFFPAISADGRFVAFYSDASNLVAADTNGARDVFVHDRQTGETARVSVDSSGAEANGDSFAPAISADGRFVAFSSAASNLVAGDTNGVDDVFLRDRQENTTTRVSVALGGARGKRRELFAVDQRRRARGSHSSRTRRTSFPSDTNSVRDVFVIDRQAATTTRASVNSAGDVQANVDSVTPVISGDGRFVAFTSFSDNLVPDDLNESSDVFVRDLQANTTTRASEYQGGFEADFDNLRPVDQRRRPLRRLRLRRGEPRLGRHERRVRRLRQGSPDGHPDPGERRRRRGGGERRQPPARDQRRRPLRRVLLRGRRTSSRATRTGQPTSSSTTGGAAPPSGSASPPAAARRTATACGPRSAPTAGSSSSSPMPRTSSRAIRTASPMSSSTILGARATAARADRPLQGAAGDRAPARHRPEAHRPRALPRRPRPPRTLPQGGAGALAEPESGLGAATRHQGEAGRRAAVAASPGRAGSTAASSRSAARASSPTSATRSRRRCCPRF